jgi:hypothetical protein
MSYKTNDKKRWMEKRELLRATILLSSIFHLNLKRESMRNILS